MPQSLKPRYHSARPVPDFDQFDVYLPLEVKPVGAVTTSTNNGCAAKYSNPFFFIDEVRFNVCFSTRLPLMCIHYSGSKQSVCDKKKLGTEKSVNERNAR
jgi:hypothetical protein